jgi:hypothetical protein
MDDLKSEVVGSAHDVGAWRGPMRHPWLRRIVTGAGFSRDWDESRLLGSAPEDARRSASMGDVPQVAAQDSSPVDPLRLWWLPRAHEP